MSSLSQTEMAPQLQSLETEQETPNRDFGSNAARALNLSGPCAVLKGATLLRNGDRGHQVRALQQALNDFANEALVVDGIFGSGTEAAVRRFQRANSLMIDGTVGSQTITTILSKAGSGASSEPSNQLIHIVRPGDSLWTVALLYYGHGSRWFDLMAANKLHPTAGLSVGQTLVIPGKTAADAPSLSEDDSVSIESSQASGQSVQHIVFPGDNLWNIAKQYYGDGSRWGEIAQSNNLRNGSAISIGQTLTIPNVSAPASNNATNTTSNGSVNSSSPSSVAGADGMQAPDPISLNALSGLQLSMAKIYNEKGDFIKSRASMMGISTASAAAVLHVESGGRGFSQSSGKMIIRFENHIFWDQFGSSSPTLYNRHFKHNSNKRWTGHQYRLSESSPWEGFHGNQGKEWTVFDLARGLSETAAMKSISMGAAQIMGFNHQTIGYGSVQEMFEAMSESLPSQLDGMFDFIAANPSAVAALKSGDFHQFASYYNGSGNAGVYGPMIQSAAQVYANVTAGRLLT